MRKAFTITTRHLLVIAIIILATMLTAAYSAGKACVETADCPKRVDNINKGSQLLWESLSQQCVSSI